MIKDIDLSLIESRIIKEDFVFALGFPTNNWVVLRALTREKPNIWEYDPIAEGMIAKNTANLTDSNGAILPSTSYDGITNHTYITPQRPSSKNIRGNPSFIFPNTKTGKSGYMYQLFFGISPAIIDLPFNQPPTAGQMSLPVQSPDQSYNQFGMIRGKSTPYDKPGPSSEIFVPPNLEFALGFVNSVSEKVRPLISFVVNYFAYEVVTEPSLAYDVLNKPRYDRLKTVGGTSSFSYNIQENFGVPPLQLGMSEGEIASIMGGA